MTRYNKDGNERWMQSESPRCWNLAQTAKLFLQGPHWCFCENPWCELGIVLDFGWFEVEWPIWNIHTGIFNACKRGRAENDSVSDHFWFVFQVSAASYQSAPLIPSSCRSGMWVSDPTLQHTHQVTTRYLTCSTVQRLIWNESLSVTTSVMAYSFSGPF